MPKPNLIRLTLHVKSLSDLSKSRSITFAHPELGADIEICLGNDIASLELVLLDSRIYPNDMIDIRKLD